MSDEKVILVADDEEAIREILKVFLTRNGYWVVFAKDRDEGLQRLEEYSQRISLVISDIKMSGEINAKTFFKTVRKDYPLIPVIAITGTPWLARELPIDGILDKPFNLLADLLPLVRRLLKD